MGKDTKIEWAHHTFNPWMGCTKISEACKFCYAEKYVERWGMAKWGDKGSRIRTVASTWNKPRTWNAIAKKEGIRFRVFCASLADVFEDHPDIKPQWREDLFSLIQETPHLDWLLLTKRPENFTKFLPADWKEGYPNVWLGCSTETQKQADIRIPVLMNTPAAMRFISVEPMLSALTIDYYLSLEMCREKALNWVIVGGESGFKKDARPLNLRFVQSLLNQCEQTHTHFFFKQLGTQLASALKLQDAKGGNFEEYGAQLEWLKVRRVPRSMLELIQEAIEERDQTNLFSNNK